MPYYHAKTYHRLYGSLDSENLVNLEIGRLTQWNIDMSLNMWSLEVHIECKKVESGHSHQMKQTTIIFTKKNTYLHMLIETYIGNTISLMWSHCIVIFKICN